MEIISIRHAKDEGFLLLVLRAEGKEFEYCYHPDDPHGLSPAIKQWLADNEGQYTIEPHAPQP